MLQANFDGCPGRKLNVMHTVLFTLARNAGIMPMYNCPLGIYTNPVYLYVCPGWDLGVLLSVLLSIYTE